MHICWGLFRGMCGVSVIFIFSVHGEKESFLGFIFIMVSGDGRSVASAPLEFNEFVSIPLDSAVKRSILFLKHKIFSKFTLLWIMIHLKHAFRLWQHEIFNIIHYFLEI